jgi:hypothetical protein
MNPQAVSNTVWALDALGTQPARSLVFCASLNYAVVRMLGPSHWAGTAMIAA